VTSRVAVAYVKIPKLADRRGFCAVSAKRPGQPRLATKDLMMLEDKESKCSPAARSISPARQGYSELTRGKAACHLVSPILWRSARARSGWRHGTAMTAMLTAFGYLDEPLPFGPQHPVTAMRLGFNPMTSARDEAGDPS
jgi:hypothetical protein